MNLYGLCYRETECILIKEGMTVKVMSDIAIGLIVEHGYFNSLEEANKYLVDKDDEKVLQKFILHGFNDDVIIIKVEYNCSEPDTDICVITNKGTYEIGFKELLRFISTFIQ